MRSSPPSSDSEPPRQFPSVPPPQDLYATSDIRLVMIELGKLSTKADRLIEDVEKHGSRIGTLEKSVDRVRTGAIVSGAIVSVVAVVFWWALGDRISNAVRTGILTAPTIEASRAPAPEAPRPRR